MTEQQLNLKEIFSKKIEDVYKASDGTLVFLFEDKTFLDVIPTLAINQYGIMGNFQLEYYGLAEVLKGEEKDED